ncbi:cysteine desulfurase family protein [Nitrososphaera sp.]|uniref:cysteine desulfurase family protein n=1 Tax=Nitrososphaera sp. TaxID=1971748 RepID=UPI00307EE1FB
MVMQRIYLDNAASTPVADEVIQEMLPYLKQQFGNPSSIHYFGRETTRAIQLARKRVAALIGAARPSEITFTSGGTEADNLAIKGGAERMRSTLQRDHVITSYLEHDAVIEPCLDLERLGYRLTFLPVSPDGTIRPSDLKEALTPRTALVSVMLANNEVGTIQPVKELAALAHAAGALFHTDAVQAAGKIPVDVQDLGVDMLSMSSHKINGPKGVGALYVRHGLEILPLIHGGGQESALRSGTENVHGIVGFGKACELAAARLPERQKQVTELRNHLIKRVLAEIPHSRLNGSSGSNSSRLPGNAHFTFFGVNGEDLIIKLDENGIAASTGSACSVKKQKPSHVLKAMGFSYEEITGSLRLSLSWQNTREEVDRAVDVLAQVVHELRSLSPFKSKYT